MRRIRISPPAKWRAIGNLVIVVKDVLDVKNIYKQKDILRELLGEKNLIIYTACKNRENLKSSLEYLNMDALIIEYNSDVGIHYKLIEGLCRMFYFIFHWQHSVSARQKLLEILGFPHYFAYNISMNMHSRRKRGEKRVEKTLSIEELKKRKNIIIFMRPDSIANRMFILDNFVAVNFVRNIDSVYLKGKPTVKGDYTINQFYPMISYVGFGNSVVNISMTKRKDKNVARCIGKKILYAMSHPVHAPNEIIILQRLEDIFRDRGVYFRIKLHQSINTDDTKELGHLIDNNFISMASDEYDYKQFEYEQEILGSYDVMIGKHTTLFLDGYLAGVEKLLFINDRDEKYKGLYKREHVRLMIEYLRIIEVSLEPDIILSAIDDSN